VPGDLLRAIFGNVTEPLSCVRYSALSGVSTRPAPSTASVNGSGLSETPERNRSAMEPAAYLENAGNNLLYLGCMYHWAWFTTGLFWVTQTTGILPPGKGGFAP